MAYDVRATRFNVEEPLSTRQNAPIYEGNTRTVGKSTARVDTHIEQPATISWGEGKEIVPFKSELDWSPESWFGTRKGFGYTNDDVKALSAHIPEYIQIEKLAKNNGSWLKMPDGSTWTGDPRSWVQLMSKDGKKLMPERWLNGVGQSYVRDTPTYTGEAWLGDSPVMAENWAIPSTGGEVFELTYPVSAKLHSTNADGYYWHSIPNREGIKSSAIRAHSGLAPVRHCSCRAYYKSLHTPEYGSVENVWKLPAIAIHQL